MATSQLYELRKDSQPKSAEIDNKSETQDFMVTLLKSDTEWSDLFEKIEVRRFVVSKDRSTSLVYIKEKIRTLFINQIENGVNLKIHWRERMVTLSELGLMKNYLLASEPLNVKHKNRIQFKGFLCELA